MKILDKIYISCKFYGKENLPKNGSYILASNHISNVDPFVVGICCWRKFSYIAKEALFKNKLMGWYWDKVGAIPIKRDTSDFRAIREALKRMEKGCPLILFPEGTRGVGGRSKKNQPGVGLIAVRSQKPVIPVYLKGSDKVLPEGAKWFKRNRITVIIGKPIYFSKDQDYQKISNQIMQSIYSLAK